MDLSQKAAVDFSGLIHPSRPVYCLIHCLAIHTHYSFDALDKVEGEQHSWMRRCLPLLIGVIVTPLTAAVHHETTLAHVVDESDTNLPVSRGRADTGST